MKLSIIITALFAALADGYTNPITIKGYAMFDAKTGTSFAVKGIDYYPRPNAGSLNVNNYDFFTDAHYDVWKDDIEHLAATGVNAVRLYAVDPSKSHDKFMCALRAKGMYALIDLAANCEDCAITQKAYPSCYPAHLKTRGEMIVLAFAKYDNVLAFSAGNEVNNEVGSDASVNAPCQKKFLRDMRAFIGGCKNVRKIPVGVVTADTAASKNSREINAKYYSCRTNADDKYENAEWYGLNAYQYCDSTIKKLEDAAGFRKLQTDFVDYGMTIPVMLTEYGCLNPSFPTINKYEAQRTWLQAGWLYSSSFRKVFSGGFVFEYSTEKENSKTSAWPFTAFGDGNYGLGYFDPENCDHKNVSCKYVAMPNYNNLAAQYKGINISGESSMTAFKPDRSTTPECPTGFPILAKSTWSADALESLACPSDVQSYTCPNQVSSGVWAGDSGSGTDGSSSHTGGSSPSPSPSPTTTTPSSEAAPHFSLAASAMSITFVSALLNILF